MFGIDLQDSLAGPWERARGPLKETLDQMKAELRGRWNSLSGTDNQLSNIAIGGGNTTQSRYVANTGTHGKPKWDLVNLVNGVKNRLAFIHVAQVSAAILLGRRSGSSGDLEEITPSASELAVTSTSLGLVATGVVAGTYGDASNVARVTVDSKGRLTAVANVAITSGSGSSWIPMVDGSEPPVFITNGAGVLVLVAGP